MIITIHAAKTQLSKLIERACGGEEIVIARDREPVAKLVPIEPPARRFGALAGKIDLPQSFFDPLPDEELDAWDQ